MKAAILLSALALVGCKEDDSVDKRLTALESAPAVVHSDDTREFAAAKLDGKARATCKYEARDENTGVLTCVYRRAK